MTYEKMNDVLTLYDSKLIELEDGGWRLNSQIRHAVTLLPKMRSMLSEYPTPWEELKQWLGFLQGVFFCNGIYSLDEMKAHNRSEIA